MTVYQLWRYKLKTIKILLIQAITIRHVTRIKVLWMRSVNVARVH